VVSAGSYILSAAALVALVASLGFSAVRLRARLIPTWDGAPARLVESILGIALLIWLAELLGTFSALYAWSLVAASLLLAGMLAWRSGAHTLSTSRDRTRDPELRGPGRWELLVTVGIVALVVAHWGLTIDDALGRGIFNFDSLWYHMPFAADIAQSHSVLGLHHTETVYAVWSFPQNSELLHAAGILLVHRDTLSLFINLGWLAIAFLAAWCIGRPYGRGHLSVAAVAVLLECHTLVVREPGAAKDDVATAALLLAAIAILLNVRLAQRADGEGGSLPPGWPLAAAGLAVGLAVGTKFTVLAMAAALTVVVLFLAPAGRRRAAAAWWFLPALAGGLFWYLRNLIASGNPLPEVAHLGPVTLPHPELLQSARPDFTIAHYATDTGIWRHYFAPGLHDQFGALWPLVIGAALLAAIVALVSGRDRVVRCMGAVALFGMVAYVFTPFSAAGAEGEPTGFAINVRYALPAMLAALALLPLPRLLDDRRRQWALLGVLVVVLVLTDRSDAVLRDPSRVFAVALAVLLVGIPAGLLALRARGAPAALVVTGFAALAVLVLAIGYPVERHYLRGRFLNEGPAEEGIPGMGLDSAYRWASGVEDARIGLVGTTAGFLQYGFYGTDLSNRVVYLGEEGPHGAFNAIPTCRAFRAAVNAAGLDYLVTAPFLDFIDTSRPIPSPEAGWLRREPTVRPILRSGKVTVWKVVGELDPRACRAPLNSPLRRVPQQPEA
jgi:hypothetical protein